MRRLTPFLALALPCAVAGCFTLDFDGDGVIDRPPPSGYEVDEIACSNGRDDDQDGRIDCQDEDCLMRGHCGEQVPLAEHRGPEDTFDTCSDGVDNDHDGQFDCGDRGCQSIRELCCLAEFDDVTCSDGIDNDGNGFADCADFSCRNGLFVTVCERETNCTDRIDNDGDRLTDCRDPDCADDPACGERICDDGVDNDGNGLTDCEDEACAMNLAVCPGETDCTNGVDDNGDGRTDCADYGCRGTPACVGPENTAERCSDGVDNDGDRFVDCADFDCDPFCPDEDTLAACMDGIDNDGNGFTDCNDFSCSMSPDAAIVAYCESIVENTLERCTDGIDNDGNGFVDCDDNNCRFAADREIRERCEATFETCTDRLDNNGNGFRDCADFSCRFVGARLGPVCPDGTCPAPEQTCADGWCATLCPGGTCPAAGQACVGGVCATLCPDGTCAEPGLAWVRGGCFALISPCVEAADPNNLTRVGGNIGDDLTLEERRALLTAACTDGLDNDLDGFTDCEDWDCNWATARTPTGEIVSLVVDAAGDPLCRYAPGGKTCLLGANAGQPCTSDDDCGGVARSCSDPGPVGQPFVCP